MPLVRIDVQAGRSLRHLRRLADVVQDVMLEALAGLGRDIQGIIEHDLYPCAPDVPLPIARRTKTYLSSCSSVKIDMGAVR